MDNGKALKSGIWYTISNFIVKAIGFLTTPIFIHLLTKTEFGLYNNYISWVVVVTYIVTLNFESTILSAKHDFKDRLDEYIFSILSLSTIVAIAWIAIVNWQAEFFSRLFGLDIIYINAMLIYMIFYPAVNLYQIRERFRFEYKKSVMISLILSVGAVLMSLVLVMGMRDRLLGRVLGAVIPTILVGTLCYCFFAIKGRKIKTEHWKYALPICIPYIPHLLSLSVLNSIDRVMITKICGPEENAIYSWAYTCGSIVTILLTSVNNAYAPWMGEKLAEGKKSDINRFSKIYISCFVYGAIGLMLIAPEILMLGGKGYSDSKYVMPPVAMGCVCQFMYTLYVNVEQFKKKTVGMAIASISAAVLNYVLNYLLIPRYGFYIAAYTTLIGYLFLLVVHAFLVKRLGESDVYNNIFVFVTVGISTALSFGILLLYKYNFIRWGIIALYVIILLCVVYRFRKEILGLVKKR